MRHTAWTSVAGCTRARTMTTLPIVTSSPVKKATLRPRPIRSCRGPSTFRFRRSVCWGAARCRSLVQVAIGTRVLAVNCPRAPTQPARAHAQVTQRLFSNPRPRCNTLQRTKPSRGQKRIKLQLLAKLLQQWGTPRSRFLLRRKVIRPHSSKGVSSPSPCCCGATARRVARRQG